MRATRHWRILAAGAAALAISAAACGGDDTDDESVGFELRVSPEFVQGLYSDSPVSVLVEVVNNQPTEEPVELNATITGDAHVEVTDASLSAGQVGEVTISASPVTDEVEVTLTITGTRGDLEESATRTIVVMPGEDDREEMAREILAKFLAWLEDEHPELELGPSSELEGNLVAPRLLVVSHYTFQGESYELGLSWHIMIAPDDWAELYIRPLDEFTPEKAFRLSSWSTALEGGDVEFTEVAAPAEVVR